MANLTGNHNAGQDLFSVETRGMFQKVFTPAFNIPLSITAFVGNVLIIVALPKVSSINPPSKLLLGCLASTDLCVGLITQPLYITYEMCQGRSKSCYYLRILFNTIGSIFSAISLLTLTAISVDRLLALLLGIRYRHVVTLRRVGAFVVSFWIYSIAAALTLFYSHLIQLSLACIALLLCITISTFCYMKIYFKLRHHQTQVRETVQQGQQNGAGFALNIARYRKTVSSALWIQMTLLACYLPYGIVVGINVITGLSKSSLAIPWVVAICLILLNSSLNPFLYCWKIKEVRQVVKQTVRQLCRFSS